MSHRLLFGVLSAVAVAVSTATFAQGTAGEAKAMLEKAVAAVKADKTKALDMFNKGEGGFEIAIFTCFAATSAMGSFWPTAILMLSSSLAPMTEL